MSKLAEAFEHAKKAVALLEEARKETDSRLLQQILLQLEQSWRLSTAHLGVVLGLKSHATVRTRRVAKKSRGSAKSRGPQRR